MSVLLFVSSAFRLITYDSLLIAFDVAVVVAATAYLVLAATARVGTKLGALVVTNKTELRSQRVFPWTQLVAFDHPESRYRGQRGRGPVEVLTDAGEVVSLPEVNNNAEFLGVLSEHLPGPVNIRAPKTSGTEPYTED